MSERPCIAGAGISCLDYIVVSPQVPWGDMALVSGFSIQGGGLVATAMVACARLGADCRLFSLLGDDQVGDLIAAELEAEGIPTDGLIRIAGGESPFSFIHVDERSGERTIFHRSGASLGRSLPPIDLSPLESCGATLVDDIYPELALAAARKSRKCGVPVVADLTPNQTNAELLKYVDVLIAPRHYARELGLENEPENALAVIHGLGPSVAVVTLGSDGWVYSDGASTGRGTAYKVDVVDTTGAGDTFHGAFAYGLARNWDTRRCCDFAAAVAAIKCTRPGGRTGLPSLRQALEFLESNNPQDWGGGYARYAS